LSMAEELTMKPLTFVVATNNRKTLERNFLASPCVREPHAHQVLLQERFESAAAAYNDAIARSKNDLIVFVHQDILLPQGWLSDLQLALESLEATDPIWGVLGCYGQNRQNEGRGYLYDCGLGIIGAPFEEPQPVQTLDEIVLILRKSSGLRFDGAIPDFHMYGADICMTAAQRGMTSYAISAFCIHNKHTRKPLFRFLKAFYDCYWPLKRKWKDSLPIYTTCTQVTRFDHQLYWTVIWETYLRYIRERKLGEAHVSETQTLLDRVEAALQRRQPAEQHNGKASALFGSMPVEESRELAHHDATRRAR